MSYIKNYIKFNTESGNTYVFDNVKSLVFPYNDIEYQILDNYYDKNKDVVLENLSEQYKLPLDQINHYYTYIDTLIKEGHFYKEECNNIIYSNFREHDLYNIPASQLILIVTENCNIRCKYCVYSEQYPHFKGYSSKKINFEKAKRSVDYYAELHNMRVACGYKGEPFVTFYGGEPFLEFDLICKIVEYCNTVLPNSKYHLTTNGTILDDEIIEFIIQNKFVVTFSLDGNKDNHDRNRYFSGNKGTFDLVYKNICKLQERKKQLNISAPIAFNCCYDNHTDLAKALEFYNKNEELFSPCNIVFNEVYKYDTEYYNNFNSSEDLQKELQENRKVFLKSLKEEYIDSLTSYKKCSNIANSFFSSLGIFARRPNTSNVSSTCLPGTKIAVAPDGNIYLCEKMCQSLPIGDVEKGLDFTKINNTIERFNEIKKENCSECKLSSLCSLCYAFLIKDEGLVFNKEYCEDTKVSLLKTLNMIYTVLEKNPDAYKSMPNHMKKIFFEEYNMKEGSKP